MKKIVSMLMLVFMLTIAIPAPAYAAWQADDIITGSNGTQFGKAIDIDHNANGVFMAITGTTSDTVVYKYNTGTEAWDLEDTITQGGDSIAIALDFLVINNQTNSYVYERDGGGSWTLNETFGCTTSCGSQSGTVDIVNVGGEYVMAAGQPASALVTTYAYIDPDGPGGFPDHIWLPMYTIDVADICSDGNVDCSNDLFGDSVSISDDGLTYVIGDPGFDEYYTGAAYANCANNPGSDCGAAFVYVSSGLTLADTLANGASDPSYELYPNDIDASDDINAKFGESVKISGNYIAVGAQYGDVNEYDDGSIYIFEGTAGAGPWTGLEELEASGADSGDGEVDGFGISLDMSGIYLIAGAQYEDTASGRAYIFELSGGSWDNELYDFGPSSTNYGAFGTDVAIDGNDYYSASGSPGLTPPVVQTNNDQGATGGAVPEFREWILIFTVALAIGLMWKYVPRIQAPPASA